MTTDFDLPASIAVLERTPNAMRSMLDGLPPMWINATEGPETWSPYVIVGHLIHGERTDWIPRAQIILAQGPQRRFTPFDRFAQLQHDQGESIAALLDEFARLRAANVATLAGWELTETQLALQGEHPE
ncbi:MAG: DinB family protein, partial [Gemmatimonadaceae bacterium]